MSRIPAAFGCPSLATHDWRFLRARCVGFDGSTECQANLAQNGLEELQKAVEKK